MPGAILSPPDERDYRITSVMEIGAELPDEFSVWQPPIQDQKMTGNCVAQTLANIKECWLHRRRHEHKDFSVGFVYGLNYRERPGMMTRSALNILVKTGNVFAADFESNKEVPLVCEEVQSRLPELLPKAEPNKSLSYIQLGGREEVMSFIYRYRVPVMIVCHTSDIGSGGGLHAVAAYGWRNKGQFLKYTNSWGENWSGDGKGEVSFDRIIEKWGVVEMEKNPVTLTDIDGHWAEKGIRTAVEDGILYGYPDNTFAPDKPLTRAELAVIWERMKKAFGG